MTTFNQIDVQNYNPAEVLPSSQRMISMTTDPELILVPASLDQYSASLLRHASYWGQNLSTQEYLEREGCLGSTTACRDGRFQCWVLVSQTAPASLDFYCSCETMRREVMVAIGSDSDLTPRDPEIFPAYSICSVYCHPDHRGKGYTTQMMRLLHLHLGLNLHSDQSPSALMTTDPTSPPKHGILSVLYSDIGPDFYAKAYPPGWQVVDSRETIWNVDQDLILASQALPVGDELEPIHPKDFHDIAQIDCAYLKVELSRSTKPQVARFAFRADGSELEWLVTRSKFYANRILCSPSEDRDHHLVSDIWGYQLKQASDQFITWFIDYPSKLLYLLRVRCDQNHLIFFQTVFKKLVQLAQTLNCQKIKCWNLDPQLLTGLGLPSQSQARTDSLSAVAWYGAQVDGVEWMANEKLFWC